MQSDQYSDEELALYNPAYTGFVLLAAIREYCKDDELGMHCLLPFVLLPMALNPSIAEKLPNSRASALVAWLTNHQGELADISEQARAYRPLVLSALSLLLERALIVLSSDGYLRIGPASITKAPQLIVKNDSTYSAMRAATFLGRWFVHAPPIETIFVQLGVRP